MTNNAPAAELKPRRSPLDHDEYLRQFERLDRAYTESIREYDRLVTWASGGALALSISFISNAARSLKPATGVWLASGWIVLAIALLASLFSQYFSSRTHSWHRRELDLLQMSGEDRPDDWIAQARRSHVIAYRYGKSTKVLTFTSGLFLVGGLMLLARFAFLNAPFNDGGGISRATRVETVLEKKGLDHVAEPIRRPAAPPPETTPAPKPSGSQRS